MPDPKAVTPQITPNHSGRNYGHVGGALNEILVAIGRSASDFWLSRGRGRDPKEKPWNQRSPR
jgi:hypothetical protein